VNIWGNNVRSLNPVRQAMAAVDAVHPPQMSKTNRTLGHIETDIKSALSERQDQNKRVEAATAALEAMDAEIHDLHLELVTRMLECGISFSELASIAEHQAKQKDAAPNNIFASEKG
jgi:hypothetical protein